MVKRYNGVVLHAGVVRKETCERGDDDWRLLS